MEATAGVAASRGGPLPMPSSSRKEWRAVADHHSLRNPSDGELERSKLGQTDERTIYEVQHGREPVDVDFCSITVDGGLGNDILGQRVHAIARQREELQQMEIELKAQMIARSEIMEMQNSFDSQIKEHEESSAKLQEKLHEREQTIHDLERRIEEKARELHAVKLDSEAAWAKEDLLREQNKELATFRRERDHSEAERTQHIQQIHELQEHVQEKDRQILELQDQHRVDQETIYLKDEQLKVWIARVQEMDVMHSNEQRERIEQYNQLWVGCQRHLAEMERLHIHTIQQLQLELNDARDRTGSYSDEPRPSQTNSNDATKFGQNAGNQLDVNGSGVSGADNGVHSNGNADSATSYASSGNAASQANHVASLPISPSSLLGMPTYLPPGQMTALHPFILHQQGIPHSMPSHVHQAQVGHFQSVPAMSSIPQWQSQQAVSEVSQAATQNPHEPSHSEQNLDRPEAKYYDMSVNGQGFRSDYLDVHINQGVQPDSVIPPSSVNQQVLESIDRSYLTGNQPDQNLQHISAQFSEALRLNPLEQNIEPQNVAKLANDGLDRQILPEEQLSSASSGSLSEPPAHHSVTVGETVINNGTGKTLPETFMSTGQTNIAPAGKIQEPALIDERSLLACIVRTIPAGGRIRINSTLPNRLGKMIAPLHWHDYKRKYGKLDDFVAGHPELFLVEGEYIQLREGAQEMIAATAAVAKVAAAAAAASTPYSSYLPTMSVTPMAQSNRMKKFPSTDSNRVNGVSFGGPGGMSNVKILSKSKDSQEMNGADVNNAQKGRPNSGYVGKQQGRVAGNVPSSRR